MDRNHCQIDNRTDKVMEATLPEKWSSFGWHVLECDGNNIEQFIATVGQAKALRGNRR